MVFQKLRAKNETMFCSFLPKCHKVVQFLENVSKNRTVSCFSLRQNLIRPSRRLNMEFEKVIVKNGMIIYSFIHSVIKLCGFFIKV